MAERRRVRLGAVSYLNTRPLVEGLDRHPDVLLRFDVPSRCADLLEGGLVDLGLIPVFEFARQGSYLAVPGVAIASRDMVDSVAIFTRKPMDRVRSIALDVSSRTSANLVRVLCRRLWGIEPAFEDAAPDPGAMLARCDAALLIGDPALFTEAADHDATKIDLGRAWRELTGLPFVWAVWAGRADAAPPAVCRLLQEARDRGVPAIDEIARRERPGDPAAAARIARYLRESIAYDLDGAFVEGLQRFFTFLAEDGLVPARASLRLYDT
ncbi:MAG TPA: menaquinone biosynthesis protein [Vicinamibacterales bacterium]